MTTQSLFLALSILAAGLGAAPAYETVPIPPGHMVLENPLDPYFQTDYLSITVTVGTGLRMGRYEVSNRDWDLCWRAGGCPKKAERRDDEGPDNPVARVNWHEAEGYARWLSKTTGRSFRLPTEGEWFYAFSLGKGFKILSRQYDYSDMEAIRAIPKKTWKQGRFGENAWGLADMLGNVWEWTLSCYTLSESRLLEKPDIALLLKSDACSTRILGGQNRAHVPDFINDTYNGGCSTVEPTANLGFRLVEDVAPESALKSPAPRIDGRFSLVDAKSGANVTQNSYLGFHRLVFFGFTHCPLTCPLGLRTLDGMLKKWGFEAEKLKVLFVTIDPKRDSARVVAEYLSGFDPRIVGLVGDEAAIAAAMKNFRLEAEAFGKGENALLEHPAIIYVMDKNGDYLGTAPSAGPLDAVMASVKKLIKN